MHMVRLVWFPGYMDCERRKRSWAATQTSTERGLLQLICHWLLTVGTVMPTVLEKSVFYGFLTAPPVSLELLVHFCLVTARAFMPASLIVIP